MRTFPLFYHHAQSARGPVGSNRHGTTWFYTAEDANESLVNAVTVLNCACAVFFGEVGRGQVLDRPAGLFGQLCGMCFHPCRQLLGKSPEILEQHASTAQPNFRTL
jgi:hypothetical protein